MKFRLTHNFYFPTYFRTKKEALAWLSNREDKNEFTLQRKWGGEWH